MSKEFDLQYSIIPSNPEAHIFTVSLTINNPDPSGQKLRMPAWIPGSYMIRDFARTIITLSACSGERTLNTTKLDKSTWQVEACDTSLTIQYEVYAWDLSVRSAHLDTTHGFFNGTSVFMEVIGQADKSCLVEILPPEGENYKKWKVATSMSQLDAELHNFGTYYANDYDELVDHPVELGNFTLATFYVADTPHDIVLTGKHNADMKRLCDDLEKICRTHINMFGELPKMERYVFLVMVVGDGYGGLEHRSSTALLCSRNDLPLTNQQEISEEYRTFLGLCSHEYFHTWNVKRIKPEAYLPYDLSQETYTRQLWAFEGITSYYDDLGLVRSGVISRESYLELLGQTMTRVYRGEGRLKQSAAESSFDTWTKFYKQDESAPNNIVSYYTKGALIALALDLAIRQATSHQSSLDTVMQRLWQEHGKPMIGVPEAHIEQMSSEIAGIDLSNFFQRYLYNTDDIPFDELMGQVGIQWQLQPTTNLDDKGGKFIDDIDKTLTWIGARIANESTGAKLVHVLDNGPAQKAGLAAGDIIIAINNIRTSKQNIDKLLAPYSINDRLLIHAFRRDELMQFELTLEKAPLSTCAMKLQESPDESQLHALNNWLKR